MDSNGTLDLSQRMRESLQRAGLPLARRRRQMCGIAAVALGLIALSPPSLWAQGPLRRLGERIRARAAVQAELREAQPMIPDDALRPGLPIDPLTPVAPVPGVAAQPDGQFRVGRPPLPPLEALPGGRGIGPSAALGYDNPSGTSSANYNRARPYSTGEAGPTMAEGQGRKPPRAEVPLPYAPVTEAAAPSATEPTPPPRARLGAVVDAPPDVVIDGQPPRRQRGAWVTEVLPQSPAEVAGLRVGDRIVAVEGRVIASVRDLIDELSQYSEGDELRIDYAREGTLGAAAVTLAGPDGLARQLPVEDEPAAATGENRSLLGGIGSIFGGLLGGQPSAKSSASPPQPTPAPQASASPQPAPGSQPPPPPQPSASQPLIPLRPFEGTLETLPPPVPEQP